MYSVYSLINPSYPSSVSFSLSPTFSASDFDDVDEDAEAVEDVDREDDGVKEAVSGSDEECAIDAKAGLSELIVGTLSISVLHPDIVPRTRAAAIMLLHNLLFIKHSPFGTQNQ